MNATIVCRSGSCGEVSGTVQYNASSPDPDTPISITFGATPYYVNETPAFATKPCPTNPLTQDEYCNITWAINATGAAGLANEIGVLFNSTFSIVKDNHTANGTVLTVPCVVDITVHFTSIEFGNLNPNTLDNNASGNELDLYNISLNSGSCHTDLYIKGSDFTNLTISPDIDVGNLSFSNTTFQVSESFNLTNSYQMLTLSLIAGSNFTSYYWFDVPPAYAALYGAIITYSGVEEGDPAPE